MLAMLSWLGSAARQLSRGVIAGWAYARHTDARKPSATLAKPMGATTRREAMSAQTNISSASATPLLVAAASGAKK